MIDLIVKLALDSKDFENRLRLLLEKYAGELPQVFGIKTIRGFYNEVEKISASLLKLGRSASEVKAFREEFWNLVIKAGETMKKLAQITTPEGFVEMFSSPYEATKKILGAFLGEIRAFEELAKKIGLEEAIKPITSIIRREIKEIRDKAFLIGVKGLPGEDLIADLRRVWE